uniref:Uncharacterized protein n=1 Tax=Globisporangium ultimum (strain ATCC 200006 / CBS 805.95 / DAOM BR144) TaxID=431595 RepID=K3WJL3_GLOUD
MAFTSFERSFSVTYPIYNTIYIRLTGLNQLAFLTLLPITKYLTKRLVGLVVSDLEMTPAILLSADMFDALYLSKCMQSATILRAGAGLMCMDAVKTFLVIMDLQKQCRRAQQASHMKDEVELFSSRPITRSSGTEIDQN